METKEIVKVLDVLRYGLADSYNLPTPSDFSNMSSKDQLEVYTCLFKYLIKCNNSMSAIIDLCELVNGRG